MLGAGEAGFATREIVALEAADDGGAEGGDQCGIFGKTFVGPAPSDIAGYRHAGGERPLDAGGPDLPRGDAGDRFHQLRTAGAAETDVVGKNHGSHHVVVGAVHRIDAIDQWNAKTGLESLFLAAFIKSGPILQSVSRLWVRTAAAEDRTDEIFLNVSRILDGGDIGLGDGC
jgi:hypothetical protein